MQITALPIWQCDENMNKVLSYSPSGSLRVGNHLAAGLYRSIGISATPPNADRAALNRSIIILKYQMIELFSFQGP